MKAILRTKLKEKNLLLEKKTQRTRKKPKHYYN